MTNGWNFADVYEIVAEQIPDATCQVQGTRRVSWGEFDRRADGVAKVLLDNGAKRQDKLAQYLYNGPEYMESMFATFKVGMAPVNTNYRYGEDELVCIVTTDRSAQAVRQHHPELVEALRFCETPEDLTDEWD